MRLTNEQKEQLYLMTCYFSDMMDGIKTQINWDEFSKDDINKIHLHFRKITRGY